MPEGDTNVFLQCGEIAEITPRWLDVRKKGKYSVFLGGDITLQVFTII